MSNSLSKVQFYEVNKQHTLADFKALPAAQRQQVKAIAGHLDFGVHTTLARPALYITMLRQPVKRIVSRYAFMQLNPAHALYEEVMRMDLETFMVNKVLKDFDNGMTRKLSGVGDSVEFGHCSADMLAKAKQNLQRYFAVVGLVERFDESLLLMKKTLNWGATYYHRRNVNKKRRPIPERVTKIIEAYNPLDVELYRYGEALFYKQVEDQNHSFQKEVASFQRANKFYSFYTLPLRAASRISKAIFTGSLT